MVPRTLAVLFLLYLQLAIELNDPSSPTRQSEMSDLGQEPDLQPICPLDDEAAMGCLRDGYIHNVRLADLFDWHGVVASKASKRPFADLFHRRIVDDEADQMTPELRSQDSPLEVGVDVVATLDSEEKKADSGERIIDKNSTSAPPLSETSAGTESKVLVDVLTGWWFDPFVRLGITNT